MGAAWRHGELSFERLFAMASRPAEEDEREQPASADGPCRKCESNVRQLGIRKRLATLRTRLLHA